MGFVGTDAEMVQLDLGLRPRERDRPLKRRRVMVLVSERQKPRRAMARRASRTSPGRSCPAQADLPPEADDRIQHRPGRVGERAAVDDRHRRADAAPAAEKPGAVGLVLHPADGFPLDDDDMGCPDLGLAVRPRAARRQQGPELAEQIRFERRGSKRRGGPRRPRGGASTISAYEVSSMSRVRVPRLVSDTRRTSASSSGETTTSSVVVIAPSRRRISTRSSGECYLVGVRFDTARLISRRPDLRRCVRHAGRYTSPRHRA